jgi:hypothetical protein
MVVGKMILAAKEGTPKDQCSVSGGFRSLAGRLDFPMCESIEVSAMRAGPATGFWILAFGMRHFIDKPALDASSRFAAYEFLLLCVLHEVISSCSSSDAART